MIDNSNGASWILQNAKTLRVGAKLSMSKLSGLAQVSRDSISKVEKSLPVSEIVIEKIFSALNTAHKGNLNRDSHVKHADEKYKNKHTQE